MAPEWLYRSLGGRGWLLIFPGCARQGLSVDRSWCGQAISSCFLVCVAIASCGSHASLYRLDA